MSIGKITEVTSTSKKSFEDAIEKAIERSTKSLKGVKSAWVKDQEVTIKNGKIDEYRVHLKIVFLLED